MSEFDLTKGAPRVDLTGQRFGRLTVERYLGVRRGHHFWFCRCDCGGEAQPTLDRLRNGSTQSCGCLWMEKFARGNKTHGYTAGPGGKRSEYKTWGAIIRRCYKENDISFKNYGAKGVTVCDRWRFGEGGMSAFECFISDMGPKPTRRHSIERMNNSLGYGPDNCAWATRTRQARNRSITKMVEWKGRTIPFAAACEEEGLRYGLVRGRLQQGWALERALTTPPDHRAWAVRWANATGN